MNEFLMAPGYSPRRERDMRSTGSRVLSFKPGFVKAFLVRPSEDDELAEKVRELEDRDRLRLADAMEATVRLQIRR
ncbi:MAG: hypothetical protein GY926_03955 [bacterium]|nr:hypothetical protein [bacterium]